jgi:C_GCAxxG_C_C family probable redox protein
MAVAEELQLAEYQPQRYATAFGAGIVRRGSICGCLTGVAMAVSLAVGRKDGSDQASKGRVYTIVGDIFKRFTAKLHTTECRELTGINFNNNENVAHDLARVHTEICCPLVSLVMRLTVSELKAWEKEWRS